VPSSCGRRRSRHLRILFLQHRHRWLANADSPMFQQAPMSPIFDVRCVHRPNSNKRYSNPLAYWIFACSCTYILHCKVRSDLPSLPYLVGDSRILDSISRSPAALSKSPAFYKQSHFPFNSTAKIAPKMHQNSPFWAQKSKNFWPRPHLQRGGDIGALLSAPSASRSHRQSSSPASLFLNLGSSG